MRRVAITSLCAIALLSGCAPGGDGKKPHVTVEAKPVNLPCPGDNVPTGDWKVIDKKETQTQTLRFHTDGRCKFAKSATGGPDLQFDAPNGFPPGFSNRVVDHGGTMISYDYKNDGTPIPDTGYPFHYTNNYPQDGGGSGIIKYIPY